MSSGRTIWQAQDAAWWSRERVVDLGEEFGPAGPAVANWLECAAKQQNAGGVVKAGYRAIARGAFLLGGADEAERIVRHMVTIGFLRDFQEGERTFTARVSAFSEDQARGRDTLGRAVRRAVDDAPAGTPSNDAGQTRTSPDMSADVPVGPAPVGTEEKRREENSPPQPPAAAGGKAGEEGPEATEPASLTARRLFAYWQERCRHPQAKLTLERRRKCEARLRDGYTEEQCRAAIDGAAAAAFVNDAGVRFDDFELIFRNGSKLEGFIAKVGIVRPPGSAPPGETPLQQRDRLAAQTERRLAADGIGGTA